MSILGSILSSWVIGFTLLSVFSITPSLMKRHHVHNVLDALIANFARNFSIFCILTYSLARLKITFTGIFFLELGIVIITHLKIFFCSNFRYALSTLRSNFKWIFFLSMISVILYLPPLIKTGLNGSIFGLSTIGNNDVAMYSLTASEFLKSGFVNSQNIMNQDLNSAASLQHQAANLVIALTSNIFHLQTWQSLNGVMIFCIASAILGIAYLSKTFLPFVNEKYCFLVGTIVIASPAVTYIVGQAFLGQIMSIPIAAITMGVFVKLSLGNSVAQRADRLLLVYLFILSSIVYPVFLIPAYFGSVMVYLLVKIVRNHQSFFIDCYHDLRYILLGIMLSIPYLPTAVHLIFLLNNAEAGWSLKSITPASLIVSGKLIGFPLNNFSVAFLWVVSVCVFYYVISRKRTSLKMEDFFLRRILLFGLTGLYIFAVQARGRDFSYYQNWKLLFYFFPILYTLFLTDLIRIGRLKLIILSPFILFSFVSPAVQWLPTINNGIGVLTQDMSELALNRQIKGYSEINVGTRPYFDSMVIADILQNKKVFIASKTTMPMLQIPTACTLVDLRDNEYPRVQRLNKTYGLIPSLESGCEIQNATDNFVKLKMGDTAIFKIKSESDRALAENWSSPESWGVWSLGDKARIHLKIVAPKAGNDWIEILGSPFMNPNLENTTIIFDSPLFEKKSFIFAVGDTPRVLRIKLFPNALLKSKGNVDISIETPDNISPKILGLSEDSRSLGFGINYLKFVRAETT